MVRCVLVLLTVTAGCATLLASLLPDLHTLGTAVRSGALADRPFDRLLIDVCRLAVAGCALWLWASATVVAADAARGRLTEQVGIPDGVRQVVLAACGLALVAGPTAAHADDSQRAGAARQALVVGLPLPDRATATMQISRMFARATSRHAPSRLIREQSVVVVRSGDTLWQLARTGLPAQVPDRVVAERVRRIHHANRAVIGSDPDLIQPGQRLLMPQPSPDREEPR